MAYTTHGHHMPGTKALSVIDRPKNVARCGGPNFCSQCKNETLGRILDSTDLSDNPVIPEKEWKLGSPEDFQHKAKRLVKDYIDGKLRKGPNYYDSLPAYEVYVVWFAKTLQNWKALLSTTMQDSMYYEVTYNGEKHETYIDAYRKVENIVVKD